MVKREDMEKALAEGNLAAAPARVLSDTEIAQGILAQAGIVFDVQDGGKQTHARCHGCHAVFRIPVKKKGEGSTVSRIKKTFCDVCRTDMYRCFNTLDDGSRCGNRLCPGTWDKRSVDRREAKLPMCIKCMHVLYAGGPPRPEKNTPEIVNTILALYAEGKSTKTISGVIGDVVSITKIANILRERGIMRPRPQTSPEVTSEILRLRAEGKSANAIAKIVGVSVPTVCKIINRARETVRPQSEEPAPT